MIVPHVLVGEGQRLDIGTGCQTGDHAFLLFNLQHDPILVPGCNGVLSPAATVVLPDRRF